MFEQILLGTIQGIAEWLPVSSEGLLVLAKHTLFNTGQNIENIIKYALFLHFGTFLAAFVYFYKDVSHLIKGLFAFKKQNEETKKLTIFLINSSIISGVVGLTLIKIFSSVTQQIDSTGKIITTAVGLLLIGTALLELGTSRGGYKNIKNLRIVDSLLLGIVQGFAALPGFSRSGLTVSALLLRRFDKKHALKISFLMSLPIVLGGNILLNFKYFYWSNEAFVGLLFSFVFGLATIHFLLKIAQKINFGIFLLCFGTITIIASLV